jgi:hypothetical protein
MLDAASPSNPEQGTSPTLTGLYKAINAANKESEIHEFHRRIWDLERRFSTAVEFLAKEIDSLKEPKTGNVTEAKA